MPQDTKKVGAVIAGLGLATLGVFLLAGKGGAAPPPPPPGLANLYGKVTDSQTGQPLSGVVVTLNGMQVLTNSSGNYQLTNLEPGSYSITFQKEGYSDYSV